MGSRFGAQCKSPRFGLQICCNRLHTRLDARTIELNPQPMPTSQVPLARLKACKRKLLGASTVRVWRVSKRHQDQLGVLIVGTKGVDIYIYTYKCVYIYICFICFFTYMHITHAFTNMYIYMYI